MKALHLAVDFCSCFESQSASRFSCEQFIALLSFMLIHIPKRHLVFLVTQSNPLSVLSQSVEPDPSIPLSVPFTLLAIAIHLNLALLLYPDRESITDIPSFSYQTLFGLSVVAPCLCFFLGRELITVTWWGAATGVVWLAHTVQRWIDMESESISELEGMKYVAPGA
jgi:hypothetical protein